MVFFFIFFFFTTDDIAFPPTWRQYYIIFCKCMCVCVCQDSSRAPTDARQPCRHSPHSVHYSYIVYTYSFFFFLPFIKYYLLLFFVDRRFSTAHDRHRTVLYDLVFFFLFTYVSESFATASPRRLGPRFETCNNNCFDKEKRIARTDTEYT